jgi:hypothetical protein
MIMRMVGRKILTSAYMEMESASEVGKNFASRLRKT